MSTITIMNNNMVHSLNNLRKDIDDSQVRISTGTKLDKDFDMTEKRLVSGITGKMMGFVQDTKLININTTNLKTQENAIKFSGEQLGSTNNALLELSSGTTSKSEQINLLNIIKEDYKTWRNTQLTKGVDGTFVMHPMGNKHPIDSPTTGTEHNVKKLDNGAMVTFAFDYRENIQAVDKDFQDMITQLETEIGSGDVNTTTAANFLEKFTIHEADTFSARAEISSEIKHQKETKDYNDIMFDVLNKELTSMKSVNMEQEIVDLKMSQMQYEAVVKMLQTINQTFKSVLAIG